MIVRGHASNGVIVLEEGVCLPEGTTVSVEVPEDYSKHPIHPEVRRMMGVLPAELDVEEAFVSEILAKHA
ncbi:MAG: hypothetical protein HYV26_16015 [Candidatus Hydrogenedentes bacterium]|nr:hypothetical protein [Candidatus Hydrogenedentota bacterium]MBI3117139.1 hypothetical protein [Candidatus Hydrogenedentota bacterium]